MTTTADVFIKADTAYWSTQMEASYARAIGGKRAKAPLTSTPFTSFATRGNPLPVQVDTPATGDITRIGEWGTVVEVPVPPAAQTVDLGALGVK